MILTGFRLFGAVLALTAHGFVEVDLVAVELGALDAGEAAPVTEYRFVTGDDTHDYPDRNPVSWKMSGSNDQKSWTVLDEQKGNRLLRDENEQEYRFRPATSGNYRYYRFEFLKMAGGTRLQLSEIKLFK